LTRRTVGFFVSLALTLLVAPLVADVQRPVGMPRIGVLRPTSATDPLTAVFRHGLRDLGYVEGHNMRLKERFAEGQYERLPALAADLVQLPVDVLVTGGAPAIRAATQATVTIPIVIAFGDDPVEAGLVASLARPGANVTGVSNTPAAFATKRLELLTELVPGLSRMAILSSPERAVHARQIDAIQTVAARIGMHLDVLEVRSPQEFESAFATMVANGIGAVNVLDVGCFTRSVPDSPPWRPRARSPPSMTTVGLWKPAACCPMAQTCQPCFGAPRSTSIRSSRAPNRLTCPWSSPPHSNWSSISRPPRHWASPFRHPSSSRRPKCSAER
jgi:ABC transporter substrate binding protein